MKEQGEWKLNIDADSYHPVCKEETVLVNTPFPQREFTEDEFGQCLIYLTPRGVIIANLIHRLYPGKLQLQLSVPKDPEPEFKMHLFVRHIFENGVRIPDEAADQLIENALLKIFTNTESQALLNIARSGFN